MKTPLRLIATGFFALLISVSTLAQSGMSAERLARYDAFYQKEIDEARLPGVVTLIYKNGEKAHESALGYSDFSAKTPMRTDQIFFIQSMTKPVVSTAFMMLYEEGHFFLNDPISKYLPEFKDMKVVKDPQVGSASGLEPAKSQITIAQVLSHTAGFLHGIGSTKLDEEVREAIYISNPKTLEERVKALAAQPLASHPGEKWNYSASPDILARLIEVFTGMSTAEFLKARLFDPLGMKDTGYNLSAAQAPRMVKLHNFDDAGQLITSERQTPTSGNTVFGGTHGLFSTAQDYALFAQMMLNGGELNGKRYLSSKTVDIMRINQSGDLFQDPGKGFGLGFAVVDDLADSKALSSEGTFYWSGAFCTYFFIDPAEKMVAVFMTQLNPFSGHYENKFRQMVYQAVD
ncbi:beta-lactamase family protein [Algoriphagus sp. H41]|uniref:Beta-lactamase family protein n=1 Tax=Algoriphagus oliviformis TaxID=2811231 RepID=A0ABS3C637_9BACT|nr:serine hydrolase domain-containing protein [Algoriphagus oliviformis]MBN7812578.1 beta-lactamase family protein [Algoriphagus oliviformis]